MRQVVFILSTNYAGSHLLSQLLGAHSACRSIGELHNYRKYLASGDDSRDVDNEYRSSPAFEGLGELNELQWHDRIFANLEKLGVHASTLVDNSKRPYWAERFVRHAQFDCRYIHLLRDPRALVSRWLGMYTTPRTKRRQRIRLVRVAPHLIGHTLWGAEARVYAYKWLVANQRISRFLARIESPSDVVTYDDIALDTQRTLDALMPRLGLAFESTQLMFGTAMSGTSKRRYVGHTKRSLITFDARWRNELSPRDIEIVSKDPRVRDYLNSLGLCMADGGLTRVGH